MNLFKKVLKLFFKILLIFVLVILLAHFALVIFIKPSLDRDWNPDQTVLARAEFSNSGNKNNENNGNNGSKKNNTDSSAPDLVTITNIRNIHYRSATDFDVAYYDKTFDLNKLNSVWYMVEPFSGYGAGAAHTLLSFGFKRGNGNQNNNQSDEFVAISVEIRKEKGESFSAVKGLARQYELTYVIADERDVIKLRSNFRKDEVYLYPVKASKEKMRELFVSMLNRANTLAVEPEFYNTLTNTCTTNIVSHVNEITSSRVPWSLKVLMPAYSDELAYKIGLIDNPTGLSLESLRKKYHINERAMRVDEQEKNDIGGTNVNAGMKGEDVGFSKRIRE